MTPAARIGVTALVLALYAGSTRVMLPGLDLAALDEIAAHSGFVLDRSVVSVMSMAVSPWITAYVLVDLVAWAVPPWRRYREDAALDRWVRTVWLACCILQGFALATALESMRLGGTSIVVEPGWWFRCQTLLTLTAGSAVAGLAMRWNAAYGVGSGFAALVAWTVLPSAAMITALSTRVEQGDLTILAVATGAVRLAAAVAITVALLRRQEPRTGLRTSFLGLVPAAWAVAAATALGLGSVEAVGLGAAASALIGIVRFRAADGPERDDARAAMAIQTAFSAALVAITTSTVGGAVTAALLSTLFWDFGEELAARYADPSLVTAGTVSGPDAADAAVRKLGEASIPAVPRGMRFRLATRLLGAYAPLEILVPSAHRTAARTVLGNSA